MYSTDESSAKFRPQIKNEKVKKDWNAASRIKKAHRKYNPDVIGNGC